MKRFKLKLRNLLNRAIKDEDGVATVEFVLIFPIVLVMVGAVFESGWMMTKQMMLDRGVDIAMRDIRLVTGTITATSIKERVCEGAAVFANCTSVMKIQLVEYDPNGTFPWDEPNCRDRDAADDELQPVDEYFELGGGGHDVQMFMRACVVVDPIMPGLGLGLALPKDASGGFQMASFSAFLNEPD